MRLETQATVALVGPLAWEPPYAAEAALEKGKRTKKKDAEENDLLKRWCWVHCIAMWRKKNEP